MTPVFARIATEPATEECLGHGGGCGTGGSWFICTGIVLWFGYSLINERYLSPMIQSLLIRFKKFFGIPLTIKELILDHKGEVLIAVPPSAGIPAIPAAPGDSQPVSPPQAGPSRFDRAVKYVMENEDGVNWDHDTGEFTNDPRDPGGATMWGIILTEYESYLGKKLTPADVAKMPRDIALSIYKKNFWEPIHGDTYVWSASAIAIFDTAVNKGLGGCMVILSDALSTKFPFRYGDDVVAAVNALSPIVFLDKFEAATERYINARIAQYPNMLWAKNGWMNRAKRLLTLGAEK
jgi:lysozyme family protein